MVRVPEYGTHNNIKYNKKRTLVRVCMICGNYFEVIGSGQARRKTCATDICEQGRIQYHVDERDPMQHAADERIRYQHLPIEQRKTGKKQRSNHKRRDRYEDELREIQRMKKQLGL